MNQIKEETLPNKEDPDITRNSLKALGCAFTDENSASFQETDSSNCTQNKILQSQHKSSFNTILNTYCTNTDNILQEKLCVSLYWFSVLKPVLIVFIERLNKEKYIPETVNIFAIRPNGVTNLDYAIYLLLEHKWVLRRIHSISNSELSHILTVQDTHLLRQLYRDKDRIHNILQELHNIIYAASDASSEFTPNTYTRYFVDPNSINNSSYYSLQQRIKAINNRLHRFLIKNDLTREEKEYVTNRIKKHIFVLSCANDTSNRSIHLNHSTQNLNNSGHTDLLMSSESTMDSVLKDIIIIRMRACLLIMVSCLAFFLCFISD
ncbi:hypothetical protein NEPAR06_0059 [Nematocida parisii]|uniref:Uncharacterized protein n=1 Tax=Nematocida parisii (strain ERTm3) TaxID=935791 RepID=I3EE26_NEMP3|nr:uncharacterized protein NEPG_00075 [Nematocida parisii ERTm1]EIJ87473.1 hypothetical protein NEQG_02354 [Nematocida parisii ERTm3]KAI5142749.1 hypothetical protein NEPAR07_0275 [Nematocida parisii]EIJ94553.1 hypothetical protein NEPG_00075 [Nematocida parisii ERTm1]KAI5152938.1 hypothetical protein NEPAR06_0059 [Nematocida parisii]KAI5157461.1 hypothetical protein NEPAR05_1300 [Nematocida parisii]|eukprot:XP_013057909.1 hypothetical protein NEPG_00075 [Nematocida parisii ERTm1]